MEGFKKKATYDTLKYPNKQKWRRNLVRNGCLACMQINIDENKMWKVYYVNETHNHHLVHEEDLHFLKSERRLTYT